MNNTKVSIFPPGKSPRGGSRGRGNLSYGIECGPKLLYWPILAKLAWFHVPHMGFWKQSYYPPPCSPPAAIGGNGGIWEKIHENINWCTLHSRSNDTKQTLLRWIIKKLAFWGFSPLLKALGGYRGRTGGDFSDSTSDSCSGGWEVWESVKKSLFTDRVRFNYFLPSTWSSTILKNWKQRIVSLSGQLANRTMMIWKRQI